MTQTDMQFIQSKLNELQQKVQKGVQELQSNNLYSAKLMFVLINKHSEEIQSFINALIRNQEQLDEIREQELNKINIPENLEIPITEENINDTNTPE